MTTISQENKKITTRQILATNNIFWFEIIVRTFSRNTGNQL